MSHFIKKCTCGITLETCRCPSKDKTVIIEKKPCTHQTSQITTGEFPKCKECSKTFIDVSGTELCYQCRQSKPFDYPMKLAERDALEFQLNNIQFQADKLMDKWNKLNSEIEDWEQEQRALDE